MASITEKRFRAGTGVRYMKDGTTVRCQAVSKSKLESIRNRENDSTLTPDQVWPEAQCEHAAVPGKLICGGRGGHGGGSPSAPMFDMLSFMPADMQEMLRTVMQNPHLLSRSFEIHQLIARYMMLYKRIADQEALGISSLALINEGLDDMQKGESAKGTLKIRAALDARLIEHDAYREIREVMSLLKDMTKVEVSSMKELRLVLTYDQVLALTNGIADSLNNTLLENVNDPTARQRIIDAVSRETGRRLNAGIGSVFPTAESEVVEGELASPEPLASGTLLDSGAA